VAGDQGREAGGGELAANGLHHGGPVQDRQAQIDQGHVRVLTTYDSEDDISGALQAGARGYLLKGVGRAELVEAIGAVHAGHRYIPADLAERALPRPSNEALTEREGEVLRRIAHGLGNREIGEALGISESTVKGHVQNILAQLGITDRTKALVVAVKRGLVPID
jgi:two-component system NarL family response regulator